MAGDSRRYKVWKKKNQQQQQQHTSINSICTYTNIPSSIYMYIRGDTRPKTIKRNLNFLGSRPKMQYPTRSSGKHP